MNARCLATGKTNHSPTIRRNCRAFIWLLAAFLILAGVAFAGVTASISGTVTDSTGAAVVGATVTVTNVDTGVTATQQTNGQGYYSFQSLPLGKYNIDVQQVGFKAYRKSGIVLDVNDALVEDVQLQVGQVFLGLAK